MGKEDKGMAIYFLRITPQFLREVDYLVCTEVDMKFRDHVKVFPSFGTLHPGFYLAAHKDFSYEHRPQFQAHIPRGKGDFYYMGAFFGGSVEVHRLTLACHQVMGVDLANGIEAVWHDESHLNRHLLDHKPLKVLSPEDLWTCRCWVVPRGPVHPTPPKLLAISCHLS
ncbi:PREDICTED: histo-blood group ABO system transferase-like [Odobenus rosmarus divergens]|uniref:Histo-blood group ABO system transferase-like n=1 Tax=Odobenus rosmarus divergens TaxID=9708 RepID=A0A9B0G938_ODORO